MKLIKGNHKDKKKKISEAKACLLKSSLEPAIIILYPNRKRDTDVQNRFWDSVGEGEGGMF